VEVAVVLPLKVVEVLLVVQELLSFVIQILLLLPRRPLVPQQ
jgi:hypothetical protein